MDNWIHEYPFVLPWAVLLLTYFIWELCTIHFLKKKYPHECEFLNFRFKGLRLKHIIVIAAGPLLFCSCVGFQEFPNNIIAIVALITCILGGINFIKSTVFIIRSPFVSFCSLKMRYIIFQLVIIVMLFISWIMTNIHIPAQHDFITLKNFIMGNNLLN